MAKKHDRRLILKENKKLLTTPRFNPNKTVIKWVAGLSLLALTALGVQQYHSGYTRTPENRTSQRDYKTFWEQELKHSNGWAIPFSEKREYTTEEEAMVFEEFLKKHNLNPVGTKWIEGFIQEEDVSALITDQAYAEYKKRTLTSIDHFFEYLGISNLKPKIKFNLSDKLEKSTNETAVINVVHNSRTRYHSVFERPHPEHNEKKVNFDVYTIKPAGRYLNKNTYNVEDGKIYLKDVIQNIIIVSLCSGCGLSNTEW